MSDSDIRYAICSILAFIVGVTVHEFAHAITVDRLGDDTPRRQGRISLNPIDHLDPLGTIAIVISSFVGFGFGWGKPVQFRPRMLSNPRRDDILISGAGPLSNLILAFLVGLLLHIPGLRTAIAHTSGGSDVVIAMLQVNLTLFFFNLIPLPPLDGYHIAVSSLPERLSEVYRSTVGQFGQFVLMILICTPVTGDLLSMPIVAVARFLLGTT